MSEERLERIEQKLDVLTDGVATLAVHAERVDRKLDHLDQRVDHLDQKVDLNGARLDQKIDRLGEKMDAGFSRMEKRLHSIEATQSAINIELSDKIENHEGRIVKLEKNVTPSGS
jgi:tetrahydromethanopterin S-methyltransferase subunit G